MSIQDLDGTAVCGPGESWARYLRLMMRHEWASSGVLAGSNLAGWLTSGSTWI